MKTDLATAIIAAIAGVVISYLVANSIIEAPKPVSIKSFTNAVNTNLDEPNVEVFNYRALNPTVEVYIDCSDYDINGSCLDLSAEALEAAETAENIPEDIENAENQSAVENSAENAQNPSENAENAGNAAENQGTGE